MAMFLRMLRERFSLILAGVGASSLLAAVTLWWNAQLSGIINIIGEGIALSTDIVVQAVIIMIVMCAANCLKTYLSGFTCESLNHDLRMGYARYFSLMPISEVERLNTGEQISKLQNEIADVSGYLSSNLFQLINDCISFSVTLAWLLTVNFRLTLIVNLPVLGIIIYIFYSSKIIGNATELSQQAKGQMNKYADTLLTLFPIFRLYDATNMILESYGKEVAKWERQTVEAERIRARLMSLSGLLSNIPLMLMFFAGGNMVIKNELTLGTLYIFLNLSGNVSGVMMNMPGFIAAFRQFLINMKRLAPKVILYRR